MSTFLSISFYVMIAVLVVVLVSGLINITRSDAAQPSRSNKLMRLRILVQFIVIVILVLLGIVFGAVQFL